MAVLDQLGADIQLSHAIDDTSNSRVGLVAQNLVQQGGPA